MHAKIFNASGALTRTLHYIYNSSGQAEYVQYIDAAQSANPKAYYLYYIVRDNTGVIQKLVCVRKPNSAGTDVVATLFVAAEYTYDPFGKLLSTTTYKSHSVGEANPLRYKDYIYDTETGWYYLQSRYYDPEIGRFINSDSFDMILFSPTTMTDKNLFSYCDNNPIIRKDTGGAAWETVYDLITLGVSIAEVCKDPKDPWAWVGLAADVVDLIPVVTGVGEATRALKTANKVIDVKPITDATDSIKIHGNSLRTTKPAVGYALRRNGTREIMKFGETTRDLKRYTNKFYIENDVYMDRMAFGTKKEMHFWQHDQILEYKSKNGGIRPPWNRSDW